MAGKSKMKRSTLVLLILLGVFAVVLVIALMFKDGKETEVMVEVVSTHNVISSVSEAGTVEPRTELKIAPDVSGEIVDLKIKEGQKVKKGDLLVTIRPDNYKSAVEQARAAVNGAKANYAQAQAAVEQAQVSYLQDSSNFVRTNKLYKDGVATTMEWEATKLKLEVSKAQIRSAKSTSQAAYYQMLSSQASLKQASQNLDRTSIISTMDGTITQLNVELGERVVGTIQMTGTEMLRIADLSQMEVLVEINENDIVDVRVGDSTAIEVDAFAKRTFWGTVTDIAYSASQPAGLGGQDQVTNFEVKVEISPESYKNDPKLMRGGVESPFRPGMSAQVDIFTETQNEVIAVPIQAVTTWKDPKEGDAAENLEVVYVVDIPGISMTDALTDSSGAVTTPAKVAPDQSGILRRVNVKTGISDDRYIVITEGLKGGEVIVTGPYLTLTRDLEDGKSILVVDEPSKK